MYQDWVKTYLVWYSCLQFLLPWAHRHPCQIIHILGAKTLFKARWTKNVFPVLVWILELIKTCTLPECWRMQHWTPEPLTCGQLVGTQSHPEILEYWNKLIYHHHNHDFNRHHHHWYFIPSFTQHIVFDVWKKLTFTIGRVEKLRILSQASLLLPSARRFFSSPTTLQATLQIVLKSKIFCQKERSAYLFINILTSYASLVPLTPGGPPGTRHRRAGSRDRSAELKKIAVFTIAC